MSNEVVTLSIPLPVVDDTVLVFKAPAAGRGGGVRIVEASVVNHATTSSTVGFAIALHRYSAAGTPALNGTVAAAVGGTAAADHFTDSVPKAMVLGADDRLRAGEWLGVQFVATNAGAPTRGILHVSYVMGQ